MGACNARPQRQLQHKSSLKLIKIESDDLQLPNPMKNQAQGANLQLCLDINRTLLLVQDQRLKTLRVEMNCLIYGSDAYNHVSIDNYLISDVNLKQSITKILLRILNRINYCLQKADFKIDNGPIIPALQSIRDRIAENHISFHKQQTYPN